MLLAALLCLAQGTMQAQPFYFPPDIYPVMQYNEPLVGAKGLGGGLAAMDLNRDGRKDVLVGAELTSEIYVFLTGPGLLDSIPDLVLRGGGNMAVGDLNGDGLPDLVAHNQRNYSNPRRDSVFVFFGRNDGPWAIDTVPSLILRSTTDDYRRFGRSIAIGDLNNDGFDDLVAGEEGFIVSQEKQILGKVDVFLGKALFDGHRDYSGRPPADSSSNYFGTSLAIGDVDGDGIKDLLVGGLRIAGALITYCDVFKGRTDWVFDASKPDQHLTNEGLNPQPTNDLPSLHDICLADANNDGAEDLITLGDLHTLIEKWCYYGSPWLFPEAPSTTIHCWNRDWEHTYNTFALGDINGDGFCDYMMPMNEIPQHLTLSILLGDKDSIIARPRRKYMHDGHTRGTFLADWALATGIGDVNGDGVGDFAMTMYGDLLREPQGWVGVFLGDPAITTGMQASENVSLTRDLECAVYPNPSRGNFTVTVSLARQSDIDIGLYDALGRRIFEFHQGSLSQGKHQFDFNSSMNPGTALPVGVYHVRIQSGNIVRNLSVVLTQ
jgi:hypothetical protein